MHSCKIGIYELHYKIYGDKRTNTSPSLLTGYESYQNVNENCNFCFLNVH